MGGSFLLNIGCEESTKRRGSRSDKRGKIIYGFPLVFAIFQARGDDNKECIRFVVNEFIPDCQCPGGPYARDYPAVQTIEVYGENRFTGPRTFSPDDLDGYIYILPPKIL